MTNECTTYADPAPDEPSQARTEGCVHCGGTRAPDPTDDYMLMLKELSDLGMRLARVVVVDAEDEAARERARPAAAQDPDAPKPAADPRAARNRADLAMHRISSLVRLNMALSLKFRADRLDREKQEATAQADAARQRKHRIESQVERVVKQAIGHEVARRKQAHIDEAYARSEESELGADYAPPDGDEDFGRYALCSGMIDRLHDEDVQRDLIRCSIGEIAGRICSDLGLEPDWDFWSGEYWALEEARLGIPGSPYAEVSPAGAVEPPSG